MGLGVQGNKSPEEYGRIAVLAEEYHFDVLSVFSDFMYQPAIVPLLIAAQHTRTIRLGPACLNPFTLHPTEIAGQIAALDIASNGRAYLGLARGAWLGSAGISQSRGVRLLRETAEIVRALLAGDARGYQGKVFSLSPGTGLQYEPRRTSVPLLIGTWSPETAALAGEIADEVKIGGTTKPSMVRNMRSMIEVGTRRARRPADSVDIVVGAVTVVDEDQAAARRAAETAAQMYIDVVRHLESTIDPQGRDLLSDFAFVGTPVMIAEQARALFEAGAKRVEFGAPYGLSMEKGLQLLGEQVVPQLSR